MNFLFIDCECALCNKNDFRICSFGYVLADQKLNIIKQEDLLINPKEFDSKILDNVIAYTKEELSKHKEFDAYYPYIKSLLTDKNNLVIGQSIINDAHFINEALKRYKLEPLEYAIYDFAKIFENAYNNNDYMSLEKEGEILKCTTNQGKLHTSLTDAVLTYECFKNLASKLDLKYLSMLKKYQGYVGLVKDYKILTLLDFKHASNNMAKRSVNRFRFQNFLHNLNDIDIDNNLLFNKKINIAYNYEKSNFREMLYICHLINKCGGKYEISAIKANYYISIDDNNSDSRLSTKKYDKIIPLNDFLSLIKFDKAQVYNYYDYVIKNDLLLTKEEKNDKRFIKSYGLKRIKKPNFNKKK